jgi:hypothetical protein
MDKFPENRKEALKNTLIRDIEAAKDWFETDVEPHIIERTKIQKFDEDYYTDKFPELSKDCTVTSPSVWDAIERKCASLVKIFHSSVDTVQVTGHQNAQNMRDVLSHFTKVKNRGLLIDYQWFKDAFINLKGLVKVSWVKEYGKKKEQVQLTDEQIAMLEQDPSVLEVKKLQEISPAMPAAPVDMTNPLTAVLQQQLATPAVFLCEVTKEVLVEDYPRIENMSASEFRWDKHAKSIKDATFTDCRKTVSIDYLRKNVKRTRPDGTETGMYDAKAVEEVAAGAGEDTEDTNYDTEKKTPSSIDDYNSDVANDDPARTVQIHECRRYFDIDGDGKLEFVLATVSNKVLLRVEVLDEKDRHPVFDISPTIDTQRVWPEKGMIDAAAQYQNAETALVRQAIIYVAKKNRPQTGIDSTRIVDYDQLIEGAEYIETNGNPAEVLFPLTTDGQLAAETLPLIEYVKDKFETVSSTTAYTQGKDSPSMNDTATGVQILTAKADMPTDLYARIFSETGKLELMQYLGWMIQTYLEKPVEIPVQDGPPKLITREMLQGDFTYIPDSTLGTGVKETAVAMLGNMMKDYPAMIEAGIANEKNVWKAKKKQLEEAGIKNYEDYILPEEQVDQNIAMKKQQQQMMMEQQMQQQQQQAMMQQQGQQHQMQMKQMDLQKKQLELQGKAMKSSGVPAQNQRY